ncbi:hypothetical protein GCM10010191_90080 [Actinomadura vinacea]|uniref:Uncharacterized protein n=1 Tax=Actinomadura vinacea TaxID=115336 RepID=A0ABN3KDG7_9ACTN
MTWTAADEVAILWAEHSGLTFPDGMGGLDAPSGESLAALDTYMAGCIQAYLVSGTLDARRHRILRSCAEQLGGVRPQLSGKDSDYVSRLLKMAELIDTNVTAPS